MKSRKNSVLTTLIAVLGLLFFSASVYAQGYWNHNDDYNMSWWNSNIPSQYQLSSDQVNKLNDFRLEYDKKIIPLQNELRDLRTEMRGYMNRTDFKPDQVNNYRKQVRDIEDQIAEYRLDYRKNTNSLLTDNQKTYFNNSTNGWWNGFYDRCGWDYDGNDYDYGNNSMMKGRNGYRCW